MSRATKNGRTSATTTQEEPGLLDLFPTVADAKVGEKRVAVAISIDAIGPDPEQPRRDADSELVESIRLDGVLQPITVRPESDPARIAAGVLYRIKFGERRYRGSLAAGRTTIPAFIDESADEDEARRLIRQWAENKHKRLPPNDEAQFFLRIRALMPTASVAQLAKVLDVPKSTFTDRIAVAEAPAPFKELFESGELSPSAGPLVRPYAAVPEKILKTAIKTARSWYPWNEHYDGQGGAVPLPVVERTLRDVICGRVLREIPSKLDLLYQGERVTIDKKEYATDVELFEKTLRAQQEEEAKAERAKAKSKSKPAKPAKKELSPSEKKAKAKADREAAKKAVEDAKWQLAAPKIVDAVVAAIKKAPAHATSVMATELFNSFEWGGSNLFDDLNFSQDTSKKVTKLGVPLGRTAEDWIRHVIVCLLYIAIDRLLNDKELDEYAVSQITAAINELELKVDVKKILDAVELPAAKQPEPKAASVTKKAKGKKK